ncbi:Membrane-bound lysozyme-inhibitor of c-type lysozyme [Falsiruegeria litorea R37]|uniref:Membrane-bound lysozyme-inhibitor of c-type lysozyme n=1 Tax=Falsiruegeria litorea R37 TaxID=1200284 RepID=A0A1Y5T732_9RHOB|nr:MliC family protein [Falsiruegeria litorea]SLN54031.1 Membrane-bound lysozyme-inhibitor of c-type lysozyme [Falsiruegeria litorea R37]
MKHWFVAVLLVSVSSVVHAADPSFDCARAQSDAEVAVCTSEALAELDVETARLYQLAVAGVSGARLDELKAMQRGWIKGRDECWKSSLDLSTCVANEYAFRIMDLRTGYSDARSDDASGISLGPKVLDCDGFDAAIGVVFVNGQTPMAVLRWRDNAVALSRVPSGSGGKYQSSAGLDGVASLFTKGSEAMFTPPGGAQLTCRVEEVG